jgi:hypothetical protein
MVLEEDMSLGNLHLLVLENRENRDAGKTGT